MQLGEIIATYDLGLALRGESGKFEVTSPAGEIYHVTCKANHSISNMEYAGNRENSRPFMVRKVTETISLQSPTETAAPQPRIAGAPFLLDSQPDEPLFASGRTLPETAEENSANSGASGLDLVYLEDDSKTGQPVAWVSVKLDREREMPMTPRCATFNQLDAEIRKLHARLDEIRARAKKKFYMANATAESA